GSGARTGNWRSPNKKPGLSTGLLVSIPGIGILSGGFVRHGSVVAIGFDIGLVGFAVSFGRLSLGAAARALGELAFDFLDRFGLRRMLDDGDFARQAIERCFIELAFAVGLLGLRFRTVEVADHFGDRDDVARIDLRFVFL